MSDTMRAPGVTERDINPRDGTIQLAFESAPIGMAVEGLDRQFVEVNRALCDLLGCTRQWLLARGIEGMVHPTDQALDRSARAQVASGQVQALTRELRLVRPDKRVLWVQHSLAMLAPDPERREAGASSAPDDGGPRLIVSQYADITTRGRQDREDLRFLAAHDPLTGLPNRAGFRAGIEATLAHPPRAGLKLALLSLDLDDFTAVNDQHGHAAGDRVLVTCARRIRALLRADDLVARFGGDEFVVLLTAIGSPGDARHVSEQLRAVLSAPIPLEGGSEVRVTVSIGLTMVEAGDDPEDAIARADRGRDRAKSAGGDRLVVTAG